MFGIQNPIGNPVVPFDRECNQAGVDIPPAFKGEHNILCLCTAVEHFYVIKLGSVFDLDFWVELDLTANSIYGAGIPFLYHHNGFPEKIFYCKRILSSQAVLPGHPAAEPAVP